MGERGPVPKRSDQRHGHRAKSTTAAVTTGSSRSCVQPAPDPQWHPMAAAWYAALGQSGQSDYYEASDWATAQIWTEVLSRQLNAGQRMSSQMVAAWSAGATTLLATEGDRRRLSLELERLPVATDGPDEVEDELDKHRSRRARQSPGHAAGGSA